MSRLALIARTLPKLGWRNVARVGCYKLRLKSGWRPQPLPSQCPEGEVFVSNQGGQVGIDQSFPARLSIFGWYETLHNTPPDWHTDPLGLTARLNPDQDWVNALQTLDGADVKPYWELSRFYWLPQFALAARKGDRAAAARMEQWLQDWIAKNPPFRGINWACGQEAAIRLMNLALTALILETWRSPSPALKWLIETHSRRIRPTLSYALGQDNNHGTAEACALFVAGSWGREWAMPGAARTARTGRKWANNRALRMIQPDGSPCQYSTTYHRANLEGFSMAGLWAVRTGAKCFDENAIDRIAEGARWLHAITDPASGDAPNLGSNDSSHLFSVPQSPYRDFRPTIAMVAALFSDGKPWADYTDKRLEALGIKESGTTWLPAQSRFCENGGFHILQLNNTMAFMRFPRFRFRPSQADALHVDLWHSGINLIRDAGTYSYTSEEAEWFSGTAAHNTIEFDSRSQMPRLGRFLFGDWLDSEAVERISEKNLKVSAAAAYTDGFGARHQREICLSTDSLICYDTISGQFEEACLRWRLAPGEWQLADNSIRNGKYSISIEMDGMPLTPTLSMTMESLLYLHKAEIPVLSVKVERPGQLITKVNF